MINLPLYPIRLLQGLTLISVAFTSPSLLAQTLPLSDNLIPFHSEDGIRLLQNSQALADYGSLSNHFVSQSNQAYCGVASMVMVLNALGIDPPAASPWQQRYFTQENVLNSQTEAIVPTAVIQQQGLTLAELAGILEQYSLKVDRYYGANVTLEAFRDGIVANLQEPNNYVLINYLRLRIAQERGGHISPIAAYNAESDRFLILDVSRYKYPPVWVKAEELWQAINTVDASSGLTRGFLMVSAPDPL